MILMTILMMILIMILTMILAPGPNHQQISMPILHDDHCAQVQATKTFQGYVYEPQRALCTERLSRGGGSFFKNILGFLAPEERP